jgi:cAMP phosphodiesterase
VRLQLLPSTLDENGAASQRQHLTCFVVDDRVAFDAGSLAMSATPLQKLQVRDIVLTHAHLDHIAGLPLFVDDLFAVLTQPINVHATAEVIEILERDVFNWSVYPRFSELDNGNGPVIRYKEFCPGSSFDVGGLNVLAVNVNHKVPTTGFVVSNGEATVALTGDTAEMDGFWETVNSIESLSAILVECAFPDELDQLANISHHLTPKRLRAELEKCTQENCPIYAINLKPMYYLEIVRQLGELGIPNLEVLAVGKVYDW